VLGGFRCQADCHSSTLFVAIIFNRGLNGVLGQN
jgi:hypothetical protein